MKKIRMIIKELKISRIKKFYDLILLQEDGTLALNISIGENEADNMALCIDNLSSPRPLTYDIFREIMIRFDITLKEIIINKFFDGNFYASAVVTSENKEEIFDMRPSDAINMALRAGCPVYATQNILEEAGFDYSKYFAENVICSDADTIESIDNLSIFGINMLNDLLKDAIEKEDYITASLLRDKINKINSTTQD